MLSRQLADAGHYPAIDIESSISRVMANLAPPKQIDWAQRFKGLYARYQRNHDLISVGAYVAGSDPQLDQAIKLYPALESFLRQGMFEQESHADSMQKFYALPLTS